MKNTNAKKTGWLYLGMILFVLVANVGLAVLMVMAVVMGSNSPIEDMLMSPYFLIIISQAMFLIPVGFFYLVTGSRPGQYMSYKKLGLESMLLCLVFSICAYPFVEVVAVAASSISFFENETLSGVMDLPLPASILLVAVLPAISEEFICRGTMYGLLRKNGIIPAAVVSGLLFGLMHMNFIQFSYTFILGIIYALLIEATGSMWAPVIAHFTNNACSLVLSEFFSDTELSVASIAIMIAVAGLGVYLCWLIFRRLAKLNGRTIHMTLIKTQHTGQEHVSVPLVIGIIITAAIIGVTEMSYFMNHIFSGFAEFM